MLLFNLTQKEGDFLKIVWPSNKTSTLARRLYKFLVKWHEIRMLLQKGFNPIVRGFGHTKVMAYVTCHDTFIQVSILTLSSEKDVILDKKISNLCQTNVSI